MDWIQATRTALGAQTLETMLDGHVDLGGTVL
jgi:hypothetical protein